MGAVEKNRGLLFVCAPWNKRKKINIFIEEYQLFGRKAASIMLKYYYTEQ